MFKTWKNLRKYKKQNFNNDQMQQIRLGLEQNLDVNKYANPKFNWLQMSQIRNELKSTKTKTKTKITKDILDEIKFID